MLVGKSVDFIGMLEKMWILFSCRKNDHRKYCHRKYGHRKYGHRKKVAAPSSTASVATLKCKTMQ